MTLLLKNSPAPYTCSRLTDMANTMGALPRQLKGSWRSFDPRLVAIVGGSGTGKSWLAAQLQARLGKDATSLRLDDFYHDRSGLPLNRRGRVNFDHPRAMDWAAFEHVLTKCKAGLPVQMPRYDYQRHTRSAQLHWWRPRRLILVEGLWLLRRPSLRRLFALRVFMECSPQVQLKRRIERDVLERGRSEASVREQFWGRVLPMQERYVQPQARWADLVVKSPLAGRELESLAGRIRQLLE